MPANRETRKPVPLWRVGVSRDAGAWRVVPVASPGGRGAYPDPDPTSQDKHATSKHDARGEPPEHAAHAWVRRTCFFVGIALYGKVNELGVCVSMSLLICHCISHVGFCGVRVLASPPLPPPPWGCDSNSCSPVVGSDLVCVLVAQLMEDGWVRLGCSPRRSLLLCVEGLAGYADAPLTGEAPRVSRISCSVPFCVWRK